MVQTKMIQHLIVCSTKSFVSKEKYKKYEIINFFAQYPSLIYISSGQTYFIFENKVFYTNIKPAAAIFSQVYFNFLSFYFIFFHYQYITKSETKNDFDHLSFIGRIVLITQI